ncbi:hypothetical protein Glove_130g136 [Diversispora epigaea]|uniref:Protein kinase domain-containing protein n=1 Tax=Diversispora epigaea TaxID=1348612 RepID=A0A397J2R0_9GLOM|nr:hypothetical protein Glove_130g136 [Diversispora epigaea]
MENTYSNENEFLQYLKLAEEENVDAQFDLENCYIHGIGTTKDDEKAFQNGIGTTKDEGKAFEWYLKPAEGGNHKGQSDLRYCYHNGTIKDEEIAFQWYLKSAEGGNQKHSSGGNSSGQYQLGCFHRNGIGTTKDEGKAFEWYLKSSEEGNPMGQYSLGYSYHNRIGTTKDEKKAFQWYLKSAEGGNSLGQSALENCYLYGMGTIKDEGKAFEWYLKSTKGGNSSGQYRLGDCYYNEIGTTKDETKAFQLYLKSAEGGNNDGQLVLEGENFWDRTILDFVIGTTKDEERAFQWYLKLAEGGDNDRQCNLGYCYQSGIETTKNEEKAFYLLSNGYGVTKDEEKAFQWYLKSAEGENHAGQNNLGYCYRNGIGITKNDEKAFQWYLKSAEGGANKGQYNLGYCYRHGIGTTKDEEKAFQWFLKSAEGGEKFGHNCKLIKMPKWTSEYLAERGFGSISIWKAEWIDMPEEVFEFYKSNQLTSNFQCCDKYVLPILGITQDSMTKEYAIVLRYMKNGNLRDFLNQNKSLPWIERLWLLNSFIMGLKVIHSKGFVHLNESSSSGTYGVLPYIAPEVFNKYQCTQASDIYSVGMIMWIISTRKKPFAIRAYDSELAVDIFNGLRPKINKGTPQCYIELMEKCWHKDPAERPNAEMISDISEYWIKKMQDENEDENEDLSSDETEETTHSEANVINIQRKKPKLKYLKNISDNDIGEVINELITSITLIVKEGYELNFH